VHLSRSDRTDGVASITPFADLTTQVETVAKSTEHFAASMRAAAERITADYTAMTKVAQQFAVNTNAADAIAAYQERMTDIAKSVQASFARFNEAIRIPEIAVSKFAVPEILSKAIAQANAAFAALPRRTRDDLRLWASRGWYPDSEMSLPLQTEVANAIRSGETQEVDEALAEYYSQNAAVTGERIGRAFPHRRVYIEKAIRAHQAGDYELSVPAFSGSSGRNLQGANHSLPVQGACWTPGPASRVAIRRTDGWRFLSGRLTFAAYRDASDFDA
jgi:hypothetical protein